MLTNLTLLLAALLVAAPQEDAPPPEKAAAKNGQAESFSTGPIGWSAEKPRMDRRPTQGVPPTISSDPGSTDVKVNQDSGFSPQNESSIEVNPLNPLNLVGACNDYRTGNVQTGHFTSLDGGKTWIDGVFPVKPGYSFSGDACVTFDHLGNAYIACMQYFSAQGSAVYIYKSVDGGVTWDSGTMIDLDSSNDKPMISCDLSQGPHRGNIVVAWNRFGAPGGDHTYVSNSFDGAATWSASQRVNGSGSRTTISPDVAIGADSVVYVMWADRGSDDIFVDRSFDGGVTWGTDILVGPFNGVPSPLPGDQFRTFDIFSMDADYTNGPHSGNVYIAWHNWQSNHSDIRFRRSTDQGATWDPFITINDDSSNRDQFFPWVVTDDHGNCNVVFYDQRDDPGDFLIHTYVARSSNGGFSFQENIRLSDVSWDHDNDFGGAFIGDYIGCAASPDAVHPLWCDARDGGQDLYTDQVDLNFFTDVDSISVSTGGDAEFTLNVGPNLGGSDYIILGSVTGTSPGLDFGNGVILPLVFDPFLLLTVQLANSPGLQNTMGTLDATGSATATLSTGGPLDAVLAGTVLYFAALISNPGPIFATNPTTVTLDP